MASSAVPQPAAGVQLHAAQPTHDATDPRSQKSLRRKYQKIRHKFKTTMHTSNELLREEQRAIALARRLQEQTDGLLEMLLDINEEKRMPPQLRYDLRSPSPSASVVPSLETDHDTDASTARDRRATGNAAQSYFDVAAGLPKTLGSLLEHTPHTLFPADDLPDDLLGEDLPGYMTPNREEEYLSGLDNIVEATHNQGYFADRSGRPPPLGDRGMPSEKEIITGNPDSAYNWLRKHQPQVFLQDPKPDQENASEKSSAKASGAGRKRKSEAAAGKEPAAKEAKTVKVEKTEKTPQELFDEEIGFEPEASTSGRRKSNKNDDDAYRPKGGSSRSKRKRDDGDKAPRKKARNSGAGS